ncbi:MAG: hypothetical protein HY887_01650 [Deltaproteobacteria bacterium]|nr:hypothetical protein [Deltaproteobacteria bacterium]
MDKDTDEINLLEYWGVLVKRKKLIGYIVGGCFAASILLAFILPDKYVATASIMPPQEDSGMASAMLSSLPGGLGSLAGGFLGMKAPADLWVGILSSQSVRDAIIARFNLKEFYGQKIIPAIKAYLFNSTFSIEDTREKLDKAVEIAKSDAEIISISVEDADPEKAAQMANAFVEELDKVNQTVVVTGGKRSRLFLEKRLVIAKADLAKAEDRLKAFQEKNKAVKLDDQARVIIESIGVVKGQLIAKEIEYETFLSYASRTNPQAELLKTQVDELKKQMAELEQGAVSGNPDNEDIFIPTSRIPDISLQFARLFRDAKVQQTLFELLTQQYELSRLQEAKDSPVVQALDVAKAPEEAAKPKKALIILAATFTSAFFGVMLAFFKEYLEKIKKTA